MRISSSWIFRLSLMVITVLGVAFYLVLGRAAHSSVTELLLIQQQTIARAEKSNIITFFERFGDGVATLAQTTSVERGDADVLEDLDTFMEQRRDTGIIGGVILTDKVGIVQYNSNALGTRDVGENVSDRNYFAWAKSEAKKGEYYISRPMVSRLGASEGQTIIVVASPVYRNGEFSGVVAASVKLEPLVERFFGIMKVSDSTSVYLVDENGDLIYSNADGTDALSDQTFSDRIKNALGATEGGRFSTDKYLAAYSPITLGVQKWLLIISYPTQEASGLTTPFYVRQTLLFIVTAAIIFLFATMSARKNQV